MKNLQSRRGGGRGGVVGGGGRHNIICIYVSTVVDGDDWWWSGSHQWSGETWSYYFLCPPGPGGHCTPAVSDMEAKKASLVSEDWKVRVL